LGSKGVQTHETRKLERKEDWWGGEIVSEKKRNENIKRKRERRAKGPGLSTKKKKRQAMKGEYNHSPNVRGHGTNKTAGKIKKNGTNKALKRKGKEKGLAKKKA